MKKKLVIFLIPLLVLPGLLIWSQTKPETQMVTVDVKNPPGSLKMEIYRATEADHEFTKNGPALRTFDKSEAFPLEKGTYLIITSGENLELTSVELVVNDQPVTATIDLPYERLYLDKLAAQELPAIKSALYGAYPNLNRIYNLNTGELYGRGEWYGATLSHAQGPLLSVSGDTLRVLLQKTSSGWTVRTKPPVILLTIPNFKDVPEAVIKSVNAL